MPSTKSRRAAAWASLESTRRALLEAIAAGDSLDLSTISVPHGILGPLNLYEWIAFVGAHEHRHAQQIADLAASDPAAFRRFEIAALDHAALNVRDVARSVTRNRVDDLRRRGGLTGALWGW